MQSYYDYGMDFHQAITEELHLPPITTETIIDVILRRWDEIEKELIQEELDDAIVAVGIPETDGYRLFIGFRLDTPPTQDEAEVLNKKIFDVVAQLVVMPWCEHLFTNEELTIISTMDNSNIMQQYCHCNW